jgi:hypothetical protein
MLFARANRFQYYSSFLSLMKQWRMSFYFDSYFGRRFQQCIIKSCFFRPVELKQWYIVLLWSRRKCRCRSVSLYRCVILLISEVQQRTAKVSWNFSRRLLRHLHQKEVDYFTLKRVIQNSSCREIIENNKT